LQLRFDVWIRIEAAAVTTQTKGVSFCELPRLAAPDAARQNRTGHDMPIMSKGDPDTKRQSKQPGGPWRSSTVEKQNRPLPFDKEG